MRKGLNFLGRKNQSLFDTDTKMKDMGEYNVNRAHWLCQLVSPHFKLLLKSNTTFVPDVVMDRSVITTKLRYVQLLVPKEITTVFWYFAMT